MDARPAKRSTAASVFRSHHMPRESDLVDIGSDASLYCGSDGESSQATATSTSNQNAGYHPGQDLDQPQPTPRAAPRASSSNNPPTPKPRQAVKSSKGSHQHLQTPLEKYTKAISHC